jgi:hypothetical protein
MTVPVTVQPVNETAERRKRQAAWIVAMAALLAILAWLIAAQDRRAAAPSGGGLAAAEFAAKSAEAQTILVQSKDGDYRITRTDRGWVMGDRGGFPIAAEKVAAFEAALKELKFARALTRDAKKHARLGIADPKAEGGGLSLQVQDAKGALLANLVIAGMGEGKLYARRGGDDQVWAVAGDLPDLRQAAKWLDLTPLSLDANRIARLDIAPPEGAPYAILRATAEEPYRLAPRLAVPSDFVLPSTAAALTALAPVDVAPAPSVSGAPNARVILRTFDGLVVDAELLARDGAYWLKMGARGENPEAQKEADAINLRSGPWAYGLSEEAYRDAAPTLAVLTGAAPAAAGLDAPFSVTPGR